MNALLVLFAGSLLSSPNAAGPKWWDATVDASLARAPERRQVWEKFLFSIPKAEQESASYLVRYLPVSDLKALAPEVLRKNIELALKAEKQVSWGKTIPKDIFLDSVLPHANVTEPRDPMRSVFFEKYMGLVKGTKSPGEAAQLINKTIFKDYKVTYNTRRLRTDQCSRETIAQGMATCTGLSIMLVEACRAVGIPARVAGINSWPGRGGNHTWVEVWDQGWHFAGAAEPDEKGLDHGWFVGDASKAIKNVPENAIYAVTYKDTNEFFPLIWDPGAKIHAENVTDRYTGAKPSGLPRLMVEVVQKGTRVEAEVTALEAGSGEQKIGGLSFGAQCDVNFHLNSEVNPGRSFLVVARYKGISSTQWATIEKDTVVRMNLDAPTSLDAGHLSSLLSDRFSSDLSKRSAAQKLLAVLPVDENARAVAWDTYKASLANDPLKKQLEAKTVSTSDRTSPYLWRYVGTKPKGGWGLVVAMHGGGGVPKDVNDQQWDGMFHYYNEHPEVGGYIYLALRAPNDEWNGFYDKAMSPLMEQLIKQFVVFKDVNPDKVYTLGASHGGYGAYVIGPKIPYRFAAVHASASALTPGETCGENLLNTRFTYMVGEQDTAYGRAKLNKEFAASVEGWKKQYGGGYPGGLEFKTGVGHFVPDHDKLAEMLTFTRDTAPKHLVWVQSDDRLHNFFWLEASKPVDKGRIEAVIKGNSVTIKAEGQADISLWLDTHLVDLSKPLQVEINGKAQAPVELKSSLETYCQGLELRADPKLASPVRVTFSGK